MPLRASASRGRPLLASASRGLPLRASASRASSSLLAGGGYSRLSELDVQHFASIVGAGHAITSPTELEPFNTDWMGKYRGQSALALRPGSTQEVSRILAHCHARRLPVVPQGGNTGLVGGSVPIGEEVVLSLSRMNRILSLDETAGSLTCEAGCVLETLQQHVAARGFTMPLDLGAKVVRDRVGVRVRARANPNPNQVLTRTPTPTPTPTLALTLTLSLSLSLPRARALTRARAR